jgi:hypothetical protein
VLCWDALGPRTTDTLPSRSMDRSSDASVARRTSTAVNGRGPAGDQPCRLRRPVDRADWVRELDEGRYWCSLSSRYRIAAGRPATARVHPVQGRASATGAGRCWPASHLPNGGTARGGIPVVVVCPVRSARRDRPAAYIARASTHVGRPGETARLRRMFAASVGRGAAAHPPPGRRKPAASRATRPSPRTAACGTAGQGATAPLGQPPSDRSPRPLLPTRHGVIRPSPSGSGSGKVRTEV